MTTAQDGGRFQPYAPTAFTPRECSLFVKGWVDPKGHSAIGRILCQSNGLTKTKNWNSINEVTETSSRLHPLWPQNKWIHTPRTTDYRHTRRDRWIQTELAFTLAKNATKPNPFEIIPLQTTGKENNWKTEEALARAAVTVETERIKGSNPWCLWWWWLWRWWWWKIHWHQLGSKQRPSDL